MRATPEKKWERNNKERIYIKKRLKKQLDGVTIASAKASSFFLAA